MKQTILQITVKSDIKYQLGIDKSVDETLKEIEKCKGAFYKPYKHCAIKKDEIVSVEKYEVEVNNDGED